VRYNAGSRRLGGKLIGAGEGGFLLPYRPNSHKGQLGETMAEVGLRAQPRVEQFRTGSLGLTTMPEFSILLVKCPTVM
jgi:galactokinase/mevalonate kinase-like predicted kinase